MPICEFSVALVFHIPSPVLERAGPSAGNNHNITQLDERVIQLYMGFVLELCTWMYIPLRIRRSKIIHGGFLEWGYPYIIHFNKSSPFKPSSYGHHGSPSPRQLAKDRDLFREMWYSSMKNTPQRPSRSYVYDCICTRWYPPVISWFINPINYSYICHKPQLWEL